MERPGLRARRLQTLDECHAGRPGVGETGLEERPLLLPIGQHSENKGTETKKPTFAGGLFRLEYGGSCRIRTYDQLVKSQLLYQLS